MIFRLGFIEMYEREANTREGWEWLKSGFFVENVLFDGTFKGSDKD